jgi:ribonuclease III
MAWNWLARLFGRRRHPETQPRTRSEGDGARLERVLDYSFASPEYLATALTHPSAAANSGGGPDYERLEFLGDAVLDLAIADLLMRLLPEAREGTLSKHRASIVNGRTLAAKAQTLGIGHMLKLGKGEEKSGGRDKTSILAAAFEAVVGAIYVDGGLAQAQRVVEKLFSGDIGGPGAERDYKTELQELSHRRFHAQPIYELVSESGPEHAKRFTTRIRIGGREMGVGEGGSKKQSEQAAARVAMDRIEDSRRQ